MPTIINQATIFGVRDGEDVYADSNEVEIEVYAPDENISVVKTVNDDNVEAGEVVTYTVQFCNNGDTPLSSIVFEDVLADGLEYVENSFLYNGNPFGATYEPATKELSTVISATLGAGECATVTFQATTSIPT